MIKTCSICNNKCNEQFDCMMCGQSVCYNCFNISDYIDDPPAFGVCNTCNKSEKDMNNSIVYITIAMIIVISFMIYYYFFRA